MLIHQAGSARFCWHIVGVHVLQMRNFLAQAGEVVRKMGHVLHHSRLISPMDM